MKYEMVSIIPFAGDAPPEHRRTSSPQVCPRCLPVGPRAGAREISLERSHLDGVDIRLVE
jgi:hypothetical protein